MDVKQKKKCDKCKRRTGWYTRCHICKLHVCNDCSHYHKECLSITCVDCQNLHIDKCDECKYYTLSDNADEDTLICFLCDNPEQHICSDCYRGMCGLHVAWCKACQLKLCTYCYNQSNICFNCAENSD